MNVSLIAKCCALPSENMPPSQIQILPPGPEIIAIDGRVFVLDDAAALVSKMNSFGREFVIDYNHADSFARRNGGEAPAAGWMKKFSVGEDGGIYADVEWTDKARGEIERKEYKYISPTLFHDERTKVITGFSGAALVNFPALTMEALCSSFGIADTNEGYSEQHADGSDSSKISLITGEMALLRAEINALNHERMALRREAAFEAVKRNHLPMMLLGVLEDKCSALGIDEMNLFADALGKTSCRIDALSGMQTVKMGISRTRSSDELTEAEKEVCRNLGIKQDKYLSIKRSKTGN